jgi:hypothetical protein
MCEHVDSFEPMLSRVWLKRPVQVFDALRGEGLTSSYRPDNG